MRYAGLFVGLMFSQLCFSQLIVKPLPQNETKRTKSAVQADVLKNSLPFWDDFSVSNNTVDSVRIWGTDTTRQWNTGASKDVYVNATLAKHAPTYRVVTFDGLTGNGTFHGDDKGLTDQLVSDSIDLSGYNEADDIYLSFYWQAGGNVEIPDPGDSLTLEFYNALADTASGSPWERIWSKDGGDVLYDSVFYPEIFKVEQRFMTDRFLFRFQSYGDQDGPFDAWHLDYIYLDDDRSAADITNGFDDAAFSGQMTSPITPFTSIPAHQFLVNNQYIKNQEVGMSYLNRRPPNGVINTYGVDITYVVTLENNGEIILDDRRASKTLTANFNDTTLTLGLTDPLSGNVLLSDQDFSSILSFDSAIIRTTVSLLDSVPVLLDGNVIDLRVNDTIRTDYLLHDYYAYDDGTAEYAVGTNIRGGKVGVQFWVEEPDTLTHIDIHFPNIDPSSNDNSLTLRIFHELEDENPMRAQSVNIITATELNEFTRYALERPLIVSDTFFITYEQNANEYIGIGFDRSNPAAAPYIFETIKEEWVQNERLSGALMIRPIFKPVDEYVLATEEIEQLAVYPNPTASSIRIKGNYQFVELHNISGQLLLREKQQISHDLSNLPAGLYLLTINTSDGNQTQKVIKK